jgi:serine/threonine-protein kinase HipA
MSKQCLYCYQQLASTTEDFHEKCSMAFFGTSTAPILDYNNDQMQELAHAIITRSIAVTGVQPKLSLTIEPTPGDPKHSRFTIVGLWGDYILKPPTPEFSNLPENEDLTMHLAAHFGINTAAHSLLRLRSGELAYITKRFDRIGEQKLAMEDMCQITETLTADKYRGSMEKIGKNIGLYSFQPGLDEIQFFELTLFSFLCGNADMHLKNFSLLTNKEKRTALSPAYDLLCTKLAMPDDPEEMALTINAKKRKLQRKDFDILAATLKIPDRSLVNIYRSFANKFQDALKWIDISFLPHKMQADYKELMTERIRKLGLL